jgi:hypothetical protein
MSLTTGVLILPTHAPDRLVELAQLAEHTGYDFLWLADERFFREVYASLTLCALRTTRIKLGPCVTDPYSRHPVPLRALASEIPDEFVEALTLTRPPAEVAAGVIRLVRGSITQIIVAPVAPDGHVETTIERFQTEVMPCVSQELAK